MSDNGLDWVLHGIGMIFFGLLYTLPYIIYEYFIYQSINFKKIWKRTIL